MISAMVKQSCTSANWISAVHASHLIGLGGRTPDSRKGGDVLLLIERETIRSLCDAQNAYRFIGELAGAPGRGDHHRRGSVADQGAVVEPERLGNGLASSACSMVITLRICASGLSAPLA